MAEAQGHLLFLAYQVRAPPCPLCRHLVLSAISNNNNSFVKFPRCSSGDEECSLFPDEPTTPNSTQQAIGFDTVPMRSIDELIQIYQLDYVDLLKVRVQRRRCRAISSGIASIFCRHAWFAPCLPTNCSIPCPCLLSPPQIDTEGRQAESPTLGCATADVQCCPRSLPGAGAQFRFVSNRALTLSLPHSLPPYKRRLRPASFAGCNAEPDAEASGPGSI